MRHAVGRLAIVVSLAVAFSWLALPRVTADTNPRTCMFYIYYDVPDGAFERAALTDKRDFKAVFSPPSRVVMKKVKTKQDFIKAWNEIRQEAMTRGERVFLGTLLTHASKQLDQRDGLEFANDPAGSTLTREDIRNLQKMPWLNGGNEKGGGLILNGCNTGLIGDRGWCPAQEFAKSQGCDALGEAGFATFSRVKDKYEPTRLGEITTYLHAYKKGLNGLTGDGGLIPAKKYSP